MSIAEQLQIDLKEALSARDAPRLAAIRQIKTDVTRAITEPGFEGEADDALHNAIITAYHKKMRKALHEYEGYGERGADAAAGIRIELEYLQKWLPQSLSEEAVGALIDQALAESGVTDPKQAGRITGQLMKNHEGLDGGLVSRLVRERLGG